VNNIFSDRISDVPKSFIREILKVATAKDIISFAGGLPNRALFPIEELKKAAVKVFDEQGSDALQYSNSEGSAELRKFISHRYKINHGLDIPMEDILITSGSQQGLDLLGKTFLNEGDDIIIEEPGYLGAIQAFSVYKSRFNPVKIHNEGMDTEALQSVFPGRNPKLIYTVPNFQNPSGISYTDQNRRDIASLLSDRKIFLIEDDPYGELRYKGDAEISFKHLIPDKTIMLGSFSKTVVPGFRLGWMAAPQHIYEKLLIAKQASDLHTNQFAQCVLSEYLASGVYDMHVEKIKKVYSRQSEAMIKSIRHHFPQEVQYTLPKGGMFLWATLPNQLSSLKLFEIAVKKKVAFVPGHPFYIGRTETDTLRLNFSGVDEETIETGIKRLGDSLKLMLQEYKQ
jgi:2-aminoadipate transaminase